MIDVNANDAPVGFITLQIEVFKHPGSGEFKVITKSKFTFLYCMIHSQKHVILLLHDTKACLQMLSLLASFSSASASLPAKVVASTLPNVNGPNDILGQTKDLGLCCLYHKNGPDLRQGRMDRLR
ncbi:unnamed protein product [Protopolystoma xenopodis]|uniref:Uncharacterized protein n=1 Tax=Protopolystoma xenopodis TaxID=117903 RepID=A0A3S5CJQ6_9PLAT|nr:unnamed protein product [Protopolystoma xenopodis]